MFKIFLINMPFADLRRPSLALTQLKSVLDKRFADKVLVKIFYLNHDFAQYVGGVDLYQHASQSKKLFDGGLGEWIFSQIAFPWMPDNSEKYFGRYFFSQDQETQVMKSIILEKRKGLGQFLDNMIGKYSLNDADLVGLTSSFIQNVASFAIARKIKERDPDIITVMGGANCQVPMGQEYIKHVEQIDFIFSGPSLISFPEFVQHCLDNRIDKCHRINGVFSRENIGLANKQVPGDGLEKCNRGSMGDELDINEHLELEYGPFLDSLEEKFPNREVTPTLLFETSRGCWWGERKSCKFCGLNENIKNYRQMSPERAIDQFKSLFRYYPRCKEFRSVDNILPINYPQDVLRFINTPLDAVIFYEVRPNLGEEELRILKQAGVTSIQPGIESLSTSMLKLMDKGLTAFQNLQFLKNCLKYGIQPVWNLLVGFPGEDEKVYEKYCNDIPLFRHLPPPRGVYPLRFDRYSYYFNHAKQLDLNLHPLNYYQFIYPFDKEALQNIAYYFMDINGSALYINNLLKWMGKVTDKLDVWIKQWANKDNHSVPMLVLKKVGNSDIVYDSRSGEVVKHQLNDPTRQVLEYLEKPRSRKALVSVLSNFPGLDLDREIDFLEERGLVFQENDKFLNLVLFNEP
ncbi:MAG: RiPP maturation radical SAM C-methyltransferase [Candidatus Thorarchaeota archaeon]